MCSSHVQFLPKVPSIHPRDGREQERPAPLPLSRLGHLTAAVVVAKWAVEGVHGRDVCQAPTFHSDLQCHFSTLWLLFIVKVPFGVLLWADFYFRTGCSCLLSAVHNHYAWLDEYDSWLSQPHLHCWSHGYYRGPSARNLRWRLK